MPVSADIAPSARLPVFWGDPELQGLHIGIFIASSSRWPGLGAAEPLRRRLRDQGRRLQPGRGGVRRHRRRSPAGQGDGSSAALLRRARRARWTSSAGSSALATNDIQIAQVGFIGIAVALLGRNTPIGIIFAALLFGALINGTSVRNLDPTIFTPELATNLTLIIQGLIVLLVSAPVIVTRAAAAEALAPGSRRSASHDAARAPLTYTAFALARAIASYLTLPPILLRTAVVSIVLAVVAVGLGVVAVRQGERRLGWAAIVAGVLAAVLAVVFTKSGESNLEDVFVWSALVAAMLRYATPLIFGALGGVVCERAGVVNIGLEGMILVGAFFGAWGADIGGGWGAGLVVAMIAGGLFGARARGLRRLAAGRPDRLRHRDQLPRPRRHRLPVRQDLRRRGHARRPARRAGRAPADRRRRVRRRRAEAAQPARLDLAAAGVRHVGCPVPHGGRACGALGGREPAGGRDGRASRSLERGTWR